MISDISLGKICALISAQTSNDINLREKFTGNFEFDSRLIKPGDIFIALNGSRTTGTNYTKMAIDRGAVAVLSWERLTTKSIFLNSENKLANPDQNQLIIKCLNILAEYNINKLQQVGLEVIAITGSAGKTSTKDFLANILSPIAETVFPPESFNNDLGLAWTALRANEQTKYLILEMSTRNLGDIAFQTKVARPRIGAITSVGSSHLETLKSVENVAKAKAELINALPTAKAGGIAVLNFDDEQIANMAEQTKARIVKVGTNNNLDIYAHHISFDEQGRSSFELHINRKITDLDSDRSVYIKLPIPGTHFVQNALIAIAIAITLEIPLNRIKNSLENISNISKHRMKLLRTADNILIIDDAYNANPESVKAAINTLERLIDKEGKSWLILGEMLELGDNSIELHQGIAKLAVNSNIDQLILVGDSAAIEAMFIAAKKENDKAILFTDKLAAENYLINKVNEKDTLLFKASNSVALWTIAESIYTQLNKKLDR